MSKILVFLSKVSYHLIWSTCLSFLILFFYTSATGNIKYEQLENQKPSLTEQINIPAQCEQPKHQEINFDNVV
jgi:hypothetical protein